MADGPESTHTGNPGGEGGQGIELVTRFLDERGVRYELVEHRKAFTAAAEARAAGVAPDHAAKTIAIRDDGGYRIAVIPASERVDLKKVRELLEGSAELRLATEDEMAADFQAFELGALPPFGPMLPAPEILDRRLLEHEKILCSGGDHSHSVLVEPNEIVRIAEAQIADVCEEEGR